MFTVTGLQRNPTLFKRREQALYYKDRKLTAKLESLWHSFWEWRHRNALPSCFPGQVVLISRGKWGLIPSDSTPYIEAKIFITKASIFPKMHGIPRTPSPQFGGAARNRTGRWKARDKQCCRYSKLHHTDILSIVNCRAVFKAVYFFCFNIGSFLDFMVTDNMMCFHSQPKTPTQTWKFQRNDLFNAYHVQIFMYSA